MTWQNAPATAILAGGLARRLRPLTEKVPKALIDVNGEPFIAHQLRRLAYNGIRRVVICTGYLGVMIEQAIGDGSAYGIEVDYAADGPRLLGTAGAVKQALGLLTPSFFVMYGDSYLTCDFRAVFEAYEASGKNALMTVYRNDGKYDRSNVEFSAGRIRAYDKENLSEAMHHIDYGLGVFHASAFDAIPDATPSDLAQLYAELLAANELAAYEVGERFYEIGSPRGLEETRLYLEKKPETC
jgi:NDP-sugar pyrophosphorylase family protein